jgi:hypothetical protein
MSDVLEVGMAKDQRAERAAGGKREVRWPVRRTDTVACPLGWVLSELPGFPGDLATRISSPGKEP